MTREGVTLIELLVAVTLVLLFLGLLVDLVGSGNRLFARTSRELSQVAGLRLLLDHLGADVGAALAVEREAPSGALLVLYRPDPETRLPRPDFPFEGPGPETTQRRSARRVAYQRRAVSPAGDGFGVVREETAGTLARTLDAEGTLTERFTATGGTTRRPLAERLSHCRMTPVPFRRDNTDPRRPSTGVALVLVDVQAPAARAQDGPDLAVVTHMWVRERRLALQHLASVSSADENWAH